jgi:hypothetical protein
MQPPSNQTIQPTHVYEVQPRRDQRGFDLISDVLPFGRLWYGEPDAISNAIGYAKPRLIDLKLDRLAEFSQNSAHRPVW